MSRIPMLRPRLVATDTRRVKPPPKETDPHYGTAEHKRWAADVKRRAGSMCQDSKHVGDRYSPRGIADHDKERRDGGANLDPANGLWRCWSCHGRKTAEARGKRAHEVLRCEEAPRADGALPR
jgi:5-methylcytosine-specific restriction protein A